MSNFLDLAVYGWLIIFAFWGGIKGFVSATLGVASWVVAGFVAIQIVELFGEMVAEEFSAPILAPAILGVVCFVAFFIVFKILVTMISDVVKGSAFASLNRGMGILGGTFAGAVLLSISYFTLLSFVPQQEMPKMVKEARTLPLLELGSSWVGALLPARWKSLGELSAAEEIFHPPSERELPKQELPDQEPEEGYNRHQREQLERLLRQAM